MNWNNFNAHRGRIIASKQQISPGNREYSHFQNKFLRRITFFDRGFPGEIRGTPIGKPGDFSAEDRPLGSV